MNHSAARILGYLFLAGTVASWVASQAFYEGWLANMNPTWTNTCFPWPGFDRSNPCLCITMRNVLFEPFFHAGLVQLVAGAILVAWSFMSSRTVVVKDLVVIVSLAAGFVVVLLNLPHLVAVGCG